MNHVILASVFVLAILLSACNIEGINEPTGDGFGAVPNVAASPSDLAIEEQTILFSQLVSERDGKDEIDRAYLVSGRFRYTIREGRPSGSSQSCQSYVINSLVDGAASRPPADVEFYSFDDVLEGYACFDGSHSLVFSCPLLGQNDGAVIRFQMDVTTEEMKINDIWIEIPEVLPSSE